MLNDKERKNFFSKVRITPGCWIWTGATYSNGYGHVGIRYKDMLAHKVSFLDSGGILEEGQILRHRCDNRLCVWPEHLIPGTHSQNTQDCIERGRLNPGKMPGESNPASKISTIEARQIRDLTRSGLFTLGWVAKQYGLGISAVHSIKLGKTWSDV